jgi:hypothetical protein
LAGEEGVLLVGEDELVAGDTGVLANGYVRCLWDRSGLWLRGRFFCYR